MKRAILIAMMVLGLGAAVYGQEDDAARTARLKAEDSEAFQVMLREQVSHLADRKIEIAGNQETITAPEGRHWLAAAVQLRAKVSDLEKLWWDDVAQTKSPKYHTRMQSFRTIFRENSGEVIADVTVNREDYPDTESIQTACALFLAQAKELEKAQ